MSTTQANDRKSSGIRYFHVVGVIAGVAAVLSFLYVAYTDWRKFIVAAWLVGPPVWFFFEFHSVRRHNPKDLPTLKESQEMATKIWAGVAAALTILYLK